MPHLAQEFVMGSLFSATSTLLLLTLIGSPVGARAEDLTTSRKLPKTLEGVEHLTVPGKQWKLLWHDEFAGDALDEEKWRIGLPWRGTDGEGRHHNDQYASYIMDHNVVVADGKLKLMTRREAVKDKRGRTFHFTQGLVTTAKSFRQRFGYWEARVKIPVEAGPGLWPAFWTLAEGWPPEMDICEVWTSSNRNHQGMCYRPAGGGKERWDDIDRRDTPLPTDWTTFGMEWGPGYQVYNVNGRVTKRVYGDHVTEEKHYILLNSGVESGKPPTSATIFPNAFEVDYVRVYERPDVAVIHNGGFENEDGQRPWGQSGQVVRVAYGAKEGTCALRVDAGASSEQKIYGLRPGTKYVVSGWVKRLGAGEAGGEIGVKSADGEQFASSGQQDDRPVEVEFTSGADQTTAAIVLRVPKGDVAALFDSIAIRPSE